MFGWLRRPKPVPPEQTEAYKLGQRAATSMADELDAYMKRRFEPVFDNYLGVLRDGVQRCFQRDEAPPLTLARIEYKVFVDNVGELKPMMNEEVAQAMVDWIETFDEIGTRPEIDRLITQRIDQFSADLTLAGLKLLTEYADGLKDADVHWRKTNPIAAAQFPEDD